MAGELARIGHPMLAPEIKRIEASAGYLREAEVAISVFNALNDNAKEHPLGEEIGRRFMG